MINAYMVDPVIIHKWNGNDEWGEPIAESLVSVKGYVEWKSRLVRSLSGENIVSPVKVYLHPRIEASTALGRGLTHEDRIGIDGIVRSIIDIHKPKAFSSLHYEIYLA